VDRLKLKAESITPVHVGNGEKLTPLFDFVGVKDKGKWLFWKVNVDELIEFAEKARLSEALFSAASERRKSLAAFLKERGLFDAFLARVKKRGRKPIIAFEELELEIFEHQNTNGKYLIPGSSLKGAIRTALVYHVVKKNRDKFRKLSPDLEKLIFGSEPTRDILKGLLVSDTVRMKRGVFFLKLQRVHLLKGMAGVASAAEVLDVKPAEFELGWNFTKELFDVSDSHFKEDLKFLFERDIKTFCDVINEFALDFCNYELDRAKKIGRYPKELKGFYESLKEEIKSMNGTSFVLRLGRFKTFMNQTVGMLDDSIEDLFPKTEWIAHFPLHPNKKVPLGWMRFRFEA